MNSITRVDGFFAAAALSLAVAAESATGAAPVDYLGEVKPLLAEKCFSCHGALKQENGLRLDTAAFIRKGGEHGPAIVTGKAEESALIDRVSSDDPEFRMPRESGALAEDEIALLAAWIDAGAPAPVAERAEEDPRDHWAFKEPVRPRVPSVDAGEWVRNPIDAFIAAAHEENELSRNAPAPPEILLRRVHIDLTGLPPTREQLRAFRADSSPEAYERIVEGLLDSPRHGERWGRHWMDVWRYSDWYGRRSQKDVRNSYPHVWRWRDWIVRSLNEDRGYDRMIMEMLAADEITPTDDAAVVATGFIVRNLFSLNYDQWMKDLVEHTGKAFLGITMNCAHCHDHKYDPISQREYFRFRAFFEPLEFRHDRVPGGGPLAKYKRYVPNSGSKLAPIEAGLARVFDGYLSAETFIYEGGDARNRIEGAPPVRPAGPAILGGEDLRIAPVNLPAPAWYPGLKTFVREEEIEKRKAALAAAKTALAEVEALAEGEPGLRELREAQLGAARADLKAVRLRIAADKARFEDGRGNPKRLAERAAEAQRDADLKTAEATLLRRKRELAASEKKMNAAAEDGGKEKDAAKKELDAATNQAAAAGKALEAARKAVDGAMGEYPPLSPTYPRESTGRRTALARWIASDANPLTARVAVNHIWARHFREPLVDPVYDFGRNGGRATHPELLDWLAVEFMESGWSMKHIHRLIVTSNTYRMHSKLSGADAPNLAIDPDNRLLWRMHARRAEAEVVRDSVLHVAGNLDATMGGPVLENKLSNRSLRRSLYFETFPEQGGKSDFVALFDAPDPCDCYRRSSSIVPQQALALINSELTLSQSRLLARDLWRSAGDDSAPDRDERFIVAAFEQVLSRGPSVEEIRACDEFLEKQAALYRDRLPGEVAKEGGAVAAASPDPEMRARESLVQTLFGHTDFVTVR